MISSTSNAPAELVDYAAGIAEIRERIDSSEWWVFLVATRRAIDLVHAVLDRHYSDTPGEALRTAFANVNGLQVAVVMARKLYMLPSELERIARVNVDGSRDIIITPDVPHDALAWFWRTFK